MQGGCEDHVRWHMQKLTAQSQCFLTSHPVHFLRLRTSYQQSKCRCIHWFFRVRDGNRHPRVRAWEMDGSLPTALWLSGEKAGDLEVRLCFQLLLFWEWMFPGIDLYNNLQYPNGWGDRKSHRNEVELLCNGGCYCTSWHVARGTWHSLGFSVQPTQLPTPAACQTLCHMLRIQSWPKHNLCLQNSLCRGKNKQQDQNKIRCCCGKIKGLCKVLVEQRRARDRWLRKVSQSKDQSFDESILWMKVAAIVEGSRRVTVEIASSPPPLSPPHSPTSPLLLLTDTFRTLILKHFMKQFSLLYDVVVLWLGRGWSQKLWDPAK